MTMSGTSRRGATMLPKFCGVLLWSLLGAALGAALAGDTAKYPTPRVGDDIANISQRQRVCDRSARAFDPADGEVEVRNALSGMTLHPILTFSRFFNYDYETGINDTNPGLAVRILDELASERRANFTWRETFAVTPGPDPNQTWTEALQLYTEVFDISIDYWDKNSDRLNRGITFMEQWFNGNMILIEKVEPLEKDTSVDYLNFMKPFTWNVWYATLATVIVSAIIHQWLEWLNNERDDRIFRKWVEDNMYLSSLNFTQQYMYEPTSGAGRIFGFSMAVWAMVMGATYTANLASLFVEELGEPSKLADIDEAIRKGYTICTWKDTNADIYIGRRWPQAIRARMPTEFESYEALQTGRCQVTIGAEATWLGYEKDRDYNPECDLEWVGKTVEEVSSAFAVKSDSADKCTNFIATVLNYHITEMAVDGTLSDLWDEYYNSNERSIDCALYQPGDELDDADESDNSLTRRLLSSFLPSNNQQQANRQLKTSGGANPAAATSGGSDDGEESSLTMKAMAGTFVLHAALSALSIVVGIASWYRKKYLVGSSGSKGSDGQDDTFPIGEDVAMTKDFVAGMSLASGTCAKGNRINSFLVQNGTVDEKLQALFEAQKDLQQNQEQLAQQMELVVSMLTRMQEHDQRSLTNKTEASNTASIGSYFFGS